MNVLTFDIEEWFHILDHESINSVKHWGQFEKRLDANMDQIFQLLDKHNQKATFFCLGWVARHYPHIIKKIDSLGMEVATHSDTHQLAYQQNHAEFREDLHRSIASIENIIGKKVKAYRAPGFSVKESNKWVFDVLANEGIEIDCSIFPSKRAHGGFQSFEDDKPCLIHTHDNHTVKEFPINLYSFANKNIIFSGGGYFRLLSYWQIKMMMKRSEYVMTYFHPRDFDFRQPVIDDLNWSRKFKSYYGIRNALKKLDRLIGDFEFMDLAEAVQTYNWDTCNIVRL